MLPFLANLNQSRLDNETIDGSEVNTNHLS